MNNKELKVTEERVKAAAEKCGTAKEILKELFPEVFRESPPEWEDVTKLCLVVTCFPKRGEISLSVPMQSGGTRHIDIFPDKTWSYFSGSGDIKIEDGYIWRKKSA